MSRRSTNKELGKLIQIHIDLVEDDKVIDDNCI